MAVGESQAYCFAVVSGAMGFADGRIKYGLYYVGFALSVVAVENIKFRVETYNGVAVVSKIDKAQTFDVHINEWCEPGWQDRENFCRLRLEWKSVLNWR